MSEDKTVQNGDSNENSACGLFLNGSGEGAAPVTLARFKCNENATGWGPSRDAPAQFKSMPFQPFNKGDKIGKVADWTGTIYNERRYGRDNRYVQQYFSGQVGTQYAFDQNLEDQDGTISNFQLVDTAKQQKTSQQRANKIRQMQNAKRMIQKEREKRKEAGYSTGGPMNQHRGGRPQQFQQRFGPQQQQWRQGGQGRSMGGQMGGGGQGGRYDQRQGQGSSNKNREPSVQVKPDWQVLEELDFPRLQKLSLPNVSDGATVESEEYGALEYYDRSYDKLSTKNKKLLMRNKRDFFRVTTTDDPVIQKLARSQDFTVFGTDVLIAALMCSTRSVYSWDVVVHRVGDKLFFDKRSKSDIDYPTVSETAIDPPQEEGSHINSPKNLSLEAMFVNRSFSQQVLKSSEEKFYMQNRRIPFLDQKFDEDKSVVSVAYKYRKWDLGNGIVMLCRCEHDGIMAGSQPGEKHFLTIRAFNEWDSRHCGGIEWNTKIDTQRGAVLATELKNNSCKLARWTMQAFLAGSDYIKFGYVSRVHVKDSSSHMILSTQQFRPAEFATQINLSLDNAFGVLRVIIDQCMKQPPGKYILLKDPNKGVVRLYKIPQDSFESDLEEEEEADEYDEDDDELIDN